MDARHGSRLKLALGVCITGFALYLVFHKLDIGSVGRVMAQASWGLLIVSVAVLALGYTARILRWWIMLRFVNPEVAPSAAAGPFLASMALNNVLPFRAGDIARVVGFRKELGTTPAQVFGTLLLERLLDLLGLLVIFFVGLSGLDVSGPWAAARASAVSLTLAGTAGLCLTIFAPALIRRIARMVTGWSFLKGNVGPKLLSLVNEVLDALAVLRSRWGPLLIGLTFVAWILEGSMYAVLARGVGINASTAAAMFALAVGNLATLIPSSPGYVGTFDYFVILAFEAYQVGRTDAAALALLIHTFLWAPVTLSGLIYWVSRRGFSSPPEQLPKAVYESKLQLK